MATLSSILPGKSHGQRSLEGCQREGHDLATKQQQEEKHILIIILQKGNAKECSNYCTNALISHVRKVLKILQPRLQQYVNCELPDVQAGFWKGRGTRDQIANIWWITENAREFQKPSASALLTMPKPLILWITINCEKFLKRWEYRTTWPASWETVCRSKSNG